MSQEHLFGLFSKLRDPRRQSGNLIYPLEEVLFLTISGVVCGLEDWVHISEFGKDQLDWLRKYFPYKNGTPSHDCLGDIFGKLDSIQFCEIFAEWASNLSKITDGEVISIDGKRICGSYDTHKGNAAIHIVSAFASANGLTLGQVKTDEKSNEITAIPELLDLISIRSCLVTIDAMGCQKEIAKQIKSAEADYILALKGNQPELYEEVKKSFELLEVADSDEQKGADHGRVEIRTCDILTDFRFIDETKKWAGIKSVVRINAFRHHKINGKEERHIRYYISSIDSAKRINKAIRLHWGIENQLHWVLDVHFNEDNSRKRQGQMPQNFSLITKIAINLIKKNPVKGSIKIKRMKAAWSQTFRQQVLQI